MSLGNQACQMRILATLCLQQVVRVRLM